MVILVVYFIIYDLTPILTKISNSKVFRSFSLVFSLFRLARSLREMVNIHWRILGVPKLRGGGSPPDTPVQGLLSLLVFCFSVSP